MRGRRLGTERLHNEELPLGPQDTRFLNVMFRSLLVTCVYRASHPILTVSVSLLPKDLQKGKQKKSYVLFKSMTSRKALTHLQLSVPVIRITWV